MECNKLKLFLAKRSPRSLYIGRELEKSFVVNGYEIASDGYRTAAITTAAEENEKITDKQFRVYEILKYNIDHLKENNKYIFSRDQYKSIEADFKAIRDRGRAKDSNIYKRDLIVGLNYKTGDTVLFGKGQFRSETECETFQYFDYKYFSDLMEFFPRFTNLEINYEDHKLGRIFIHLGTRYALLLPMRVYSDENIREVV